MNKRTITTAMTLLLALCLLPVPAAAKDKGKEKAKGKQQKSTESTFKYPPLRELKIPPVKTVSLPSGVQCFFLEDHQLPLTKITVMVRTGSAYESAEQTGLASACFELMRTGGIPGRTGDQLDEQLEDLGASIGSGAGTAMSTVNATCLSRDLGTILKIIQQMLQNPSVAEEKVDLFTTQTRSAISRRNDDPGSIASREFERLIYGKDSPYASLLEYDGLEKINRSAILDFHKKFMVPGNISIGLWGDFETAQAEASLNELFGGWAQGQPAPPLPAVSAPPPASVNFINKADVNQSNIRIGHRGITMDNPDYFAVEMMNSILGDNGFLSRLMKVVRTEKGLTYGIQGEIGAEFGYSGVFSVSTYTKIESTGQAIDAILHEINRIRDEPASGEELQLAREAFLNSFVFQYESSEAILERLMSLRFHGMPADFLETFRENFAKVTREDVQRVARQYLHPDQLIILVVGKEENLDKPLSSYGQVNTIDITIPGPTSKAGAIPPATPASLAKGKMLLNRAIEVMRAENALENLTGIYTLQEGKIEFAPQVTIPATMESWLHLPGRMAVLVSTPMFKMTQVLDRQSAWVHIPQQGTQDLGQEGAQDMQESVDRTLLVILRNSQVEGFRAQHLGLEDVSGRQLECIYLSGPGQKPFRLYTDPETGFPAAMRSEGKKGPEPGTFLTLFKNPADFGGILYPTEEDVLFNGKPYITSTLKKMELNPAVNENLFKKPEKPQQ